MIRSFCGVWWTFSAKGHHSLHRFDLLGRDCFKSLHCWLAEETKFQITNVAAGKSFHVRRPSAPVRGFWEQSGGSPPDKNWAADYRKGTCIGYKILRTTTEGYETAEGTRATQPSVEGSPERVHNGFSRSENLSGQLIAIEHSHRTHMIEISCEIPCCVPKDTKNIRMVDESETWRRMVSRCSEICITSNRS
jgi:hypothetical protein